MKYYAFYNPAAGNGICEQKLEALKALYEGSELELINVPEKGDYTPYIEKLDADDVIIICGGDGTLNHFANSIADKNVTNEILYYASGTGNDFLRDVEGVDATKPFDVKKYITDLPVVEIDGNTYRYINGIGYGIDGYCCEVGDKLRAENKNVNYTSIAIKGLLFHYKPTNARVTVDGVVHEFKKVWIAPTMNGKYYGGGMMPTPEQDRLGNGTQSVMLFHGTGKLRTLMIFPSLFKGAHVKHTKNIAIFTGREISVEFDSPRALQIDGETVLGVTSYKVTSGKLAAVEK